MTVEELNDIFEKYDDRDEFLKFDRVRDRYSNRTDLHAFILLDKLIPSDYDIISGAEHDEIYLGIDIEELAKVISEDDILTLIRCGCRLDSEGISMYV